MCVCVRRGGGGGKGLENFYMQTSVYMRLLLQAFFGGFIRLAANTFLFPYKSFPCFSLCKQFVSKFSNLPPPQPPPKKKSGLSLRRSEIMLKLKPGRRHLSMNTSQSGSSMKD